MGKEVENRGNRIEELKPFLEHLIRYYRYDLGNGAGGCLHIVLDDGNLRPGDIWHCQEFSEEKKDTLAQFIGELMRIFTEDELQEMYDDNWGDSKFGFNEA